MKYLLEKVQEISKRYEEIDLISGSRFNVFNVLNITSDEVRLHSKFIAELLNPSGSHGQGFVFLKLFTELIGIDDFDYESAKVEIEKYIGVKTEETGGRIDIYVYDSNNNSIILENKIYANDQINQLVRYFNYSNKNVFYLNLLGIEPTKESYGKLEIDKDFKIISYKEHIICWLELCRKEAVELPLLREGITHYINLIKTLVGQSNNQAMENEVRNLIISSNQNLKNAILIEQNLAKAKINVQWKFWINLRKKYEAIEDLNLRHIESKAVTWQNVRGFYEKSRNRDIYYGLWFQIYEKDELTIHFGIEIENDIYYGFTIEKNGNGGIANLPENLKYREMVKAVNPEYSPTQWWLGWKYPKERLNFREFNSEIIFNLVNNDDRNRTIDMIVQESTEHIIELQKLLKESEFRQTTTY